MPVILFCTGVSSRCPRSCEGGDGGWGTGDGEREREINLGEETNNNFLFSYGNVKKYNVVHDYFLVLADCRTPCTPVLSFLFFRSLLLLLLHSFFFLATSSFSSCNFLSYSSVP